MLLPSEFSVGCIEDAKELTLVYPRTKCEHFALLTHAPGALTAIFLDGRHSFISFGCDQNTSWKGVLIPQVIVEVDETSVFDPEADDVPLGALLRKEARLDIAATRDGDFLRGHAGIPLLTGLPPCRERLSAGFTRWRVVIGDGVSKRVLKSIDLPNSTQSG